MMPSASACSRSAAKRAAGSPGMMRPPPARWSRYSRITRESNSTVPSSSTSAGILPSGFCRRTLSLGFIVSASSIAMSRSSPSTFAAIRTLRTKGEAGELRSVNMEGLAIDERRSRGGGLQRERSAADRRARPSAGDDEVDGLRTLALLVGLDVEGDALPLGQRLEAGALDGGDVHEDVPASVVRLDEAVAALGIEEFDGTCHGHRETPFPRGCSAADPHGAAARPDIHKRGKQRPYGLRYSAGPPQEAERQSQRP